MLQGIQVDWEALLAPSANEFIDKVASWLLPPAARGEPASGSGVVPDPLGGLPELWTVLVTLRHRIELLNSAGVPA